MSSSQPSLLRPALAAAALVAVGALPMAAHAQQVVRDAETGLLRAPNAAEAAALAAPASRLGRSAPAAAVASEETVYPDGTVMVMTDDSHMMYSVARRNADGSISRYCVQGKEQAAKVSKVAPKTFAKPVMVSKASREAGYELK